jgi:hypothetical protein
MVQPFVFVVAPKAWQVVDGLKHSMQQPSTPQSLPR